MEDEDMMRKSILLVIALCLFFLTDCSGTKKNLPSGRTETAVINLPTIKCKTCVKTIEETLSTVDGIQSGAVNLEQKTASVTFIPAKLTLHDIETVISKAGYDANSIKRDSAGYENLPPCCK